MRRVITGVDAEGRSVVVQDTTETTVWQLAAPKVEERDGVAVVASPISRVPEVASRPSDGEQFIALLWQSSKGVPTTPVTDEAGRQADFAMEPPGDGFFWRYHSWAPDCDASALHATQTLDLLLVLEGDVELLLDRGSVVLNAGDLVVIPAVSHGWRSGSSGCKMLQMMQRIIDP